MTLVGVVAVGRGEGESGMVREGRQIFERQFAVAPAGTPGDGLGPLYNHSSCAACHFQGRLGGGGPVDVNVVLASVGLSPGCSARPEPKQLVTLLRGMHPSFVAENDEISTSVVLHRFGLDNRYAQLRSKFVREEVPLTPTASEALSLQQELARHAKESVHAPTPLSLVLTQRNTTALFGAGLIDTIPDAVIRNLAEDQKRQGEVSGRVPPVGTNKVGRFGWRGQTERLLDFVQGACANELGLEVPGHEQPRDPSRPWYRPVGLDLTAAQCASLTAFVSALPTPRLVVPEGELKRQAFDRGREVFASVGCAACHVERIGPVQGLYSDLLLHDMGPALSDPVAAEPTLVATGNRLPPPEDLIAQDQEARKAGKSRHTSVQPRAPRRMSGYSGSSGDLALVEAPSTVLISDPQTKEQIEFRVESSPVQSEWRTPPLWGLADSAPYLHDGRAATVIEAIALHAGEADACTKRFLALPLADRLAVLEFLNGLKAPQ
jgi:CxxC motif-containing protein (DUF1111 family)